MKLIDALNRDLSEALISVKCAKKNLKDYWLEQHKDKFGIYIGVIVTVKGKEAIIDHINGEDRGGRKPWAKGRYRNKSGQFGKMARWQDPFSQIGK